MKGMFKDTRSAIPRSFCSLLVAIKRCYENSRRTHLENQPGKEEFCREQGLNRKYRSRRERVCKLMGSFHALKNYSYNKEIQATYRSGNTYGNGQILEAP